MSERFNRLARVISRWAGSVWAFALALLLVLSWAAVGPFASWSDTHSLAINTATTIITFLMVFIVQNTQLRDTAEIKGLLRELVADIPEVSEAAAEQRIEAEQ